MPTLNHILDHLSQSTVFAGLAWVLTLTLKKNRAETRCWVWFAASMKFLVPVAVLVAAGGQIRWRTVATPLSVPTVVEEIGQGASAPLVAMKESEPARANPIPELLLLVWACGFLAIVMKWGRRWMRMNADARKARVIDMRLPVPVKCSTALREPGVFGVFRPVLLLPEGITERLTPAQLDAIVAHELCHVRRRDNLMTAMHMVVEALFWFHPLVWWIGARLMEERERACDEEVLRSNDAQVYAEGILKVCEFYLKSPLECVAGVAGGNLNKRIEEIMTQREVFNLSAARKALLACAGALAVAGPVAIGIVNAPPIRAQAPAGHFEFEVASVKLYAPGDSGILFPQFLPGGRFRAIAPLEIVIGAAYDLPFNRGERLKGVPEWLRSKDAVYEIEAKGVIPDGFTVQARNDRGKLMLQALLADRFKLKIHRETKEMPAYALVVGKGGPKLQKADIAEKDCPDPDPSVNPTPRTSVTTCHQFMGGQGRGLHARAADMADLVRFVENWTDRPLLDKTGIKGLYRFDTSGWLRMQPGPPPEPGSKGEDGTDLADMPTIFTVFEKLGLKMEARKDKVDIYVIDSIERPTAN